MRNHYFTADEISRIRTIGELISLLSEALGEEIDTSAISYSMSEGAPALLPSRAGLAKMLAYYRDHESYCSGRVVASSPRMYEQIVPCTDGPHNGDGSRYARPLRYVDTVDVHGQSALYISRADDGRLHAVFSA